MTESEDTHNLKLFRTYGAEVRGDSDSNGTHHLGLSVERARVIAVEAGTESASLWVETFQSSTCGSCEAEKGCGQGVLNRWFQRSSQCFKVSCEKNQADFFTVGQWVEIGIPDGLVLRASLIAYLLPLFGLISGAIMLDAVYPGDLAALLGGIGGFVLALVAVRQFAARHQIQRDSQPRLLGKVQHKR